MAEFTAALKEYFELFVIAFLVLAICEFARREMMTIMGRTNAPLRYPSIFILFRPEKRPILENGLRAVVAAGVLFFVGFMVNGVGYWILQAAHVQVVHHTSVQVDCLAKSGKSESDAKCSNYEWHLPLTSPFSRSPDQKAAAAFLEDMKRQIRWQICDKKSYDDEVDNLKFIRMIRGAMVMVVVILACSFLVLWSGKLSKNDHEQAWPRAKRSAGAGCLVGILVYVLATSVYWQIETNVHRNIGASHLILPDSMVEQCLGRKDKAGAV